jgi:hypothetical protein
LVPDNDWFFGNKNRQLSSQSMMDRIYHSRLTRYLADRDTERFKRAQLPPKWQHFNIQLASKMWRMSSSPSGRNMKNRLLFDKHYHPGNLAKKIKDPTLFSTASECPFCPTQDSASHWSVQCLAIPRSVNIRNNAITRIRLLVASTSAEHSDEHSKSAIRTLGDEYLEFLIGDKKSPETWMCLWTSSQLSYFGTHGYYSPSLVSALRKLFLAIGSLLSDTIISLWQSRQVAELELAEENAKAPIPYYVAPPFLLRPPNTDLPPHNAAELAALRISASLVISPLSPKRTLYGTNRKLRLLCDNPSTLPVSLPLPTMRLLPDNPALPTTLSIESATVVTSTNLLPPMLGLKQSKHKKPKAHPQLSLAQKFKTQTEKKTRPHWRIKRNAPSSTPVPGLTPLMMLLNSTSIIPTTARMTLIPTTRACPPSPTRHYNTDPEESSNTIDSLVRIKSRRDPIRGHDPG